MVFLSCLFGRISGFFNNRISSCHIRYPAGYWIKKRSDIRCIPIEQVQVRSANNIKFVFIRAVDLDPHGSRPVGKLKIKHTKMHVHLLIFKNKIQFLKKLQKHNELFKRMVPVKVFCFLKLRSHLIFFKLDPDSHFFIILLTL